MTDCRDFVDRPCCCICGRPLRRGTAWTCFECERKWKLAGSLTDWPEWAKFLKNDEKNRRRRLARERLLDIRSLDG